MGGSSILPPSGSSLCAGAGGGGGGGSVHPTADDIFFTPDATYYVGYDSSAGVWGRPVYVYASTGLALGGTTPNTSLVTLGVVPAGLSNDYGVYTPNATDTLSLWSTRTDGAGNVGIAVVADVNAASISATHKMMSFQWVNNADVAAEVAYIRGDGTAGLASAALTVGVQPAGLTTDFGICTTAVSDTLTLWSTRGSGTGNVSVAVVADVNAASIDAAQKVVSFQWVNNADSPTELTYLRGDGTIYTVGSYISTTSIFVAGTATNAFQSSGAWALGTTTVNGLDLVNSTSAANGAQQYSPAVHLGARCWETTGSTSQAVDWRIYSVPAQGTTASSTLRFEHSTNGAAYLTPYTFTSGGTFSSTNTWASSYLGAGSLSTNPNTVINGGTDVGFGLGAGSTLYSQIAAGALQIGHYGRTDGASNVCIASAYYRGAASITNAATMRIHSFGWTNNSAAFTELQYMRADGAFVCASGSLSAGIQPAGLSTDFGVGTTAVTDTLSLWSTRTSGSGNISHAIVADVNAATINADHKVLSIGWVNNADAYTELFAFKDGQIVYTNVTGGMEFWSDEADGGAAVAFTVGSTNSWVTAGAKLFSVVNTDPAGYERFYVGYNGDVCLNKGNNAQCLGVYSLTESLTLAAAATTTAVNQIPQYAIVVAVSVRVTTVIPTATTFSVGISGDATRYGTGINVAAGTTYPGTQDAARYYNVATSILITPSGTPATATGVIRLTIHYILATPPTS